jgi:hypothetical protein
MSCGCKLRRHRLCVGSARSFLLPPEQLVAAARASEVSRCDIEVACRDLYCRRLCRLLLRLLPTFAQRLSDGCFLAARRGGSPVKGSLPLLEVVMRHRLFDGSRTNAR